MSYPPDPGGNFDSDAHRRVMAHLPNPDDDAMSAHELIADRINKDPYLLAYLEDADEVVDVLTDLEGDGYAKQLKAGWKNTSEGFDLLTGPPDETAAQDASVTIGLDPATLSNGDAQ